MANLFLHNEISADKKNMIVGCLAQTPKKMDTLIETFPIENWEEDMYQKLGWIKATSHKAYWRNKDYENQTDRNIIGGLDTIYKVVYEESTKSIDKKIPTRVKYTVTDIKKKLFEVNQEEPTPLQIQLAVNLVLMDIANYFSENPDMLFDFPLYTAYITKHNLRKEDYEVFDMISEIVNATQILVSEDI